VYLYLLCFILFILCFCIFSFIYIYFYLLLVSGLLPPNETSIAVNNNNNNNNNKCVSRSTLKFQKLKKKLFVGLRFIFPTCELFSRGHLLFTNYVTTGTDVCQEFRHAVPLRLPHFITTRTFLWRGPKINFLPWYFEVRHPRCVSTKSNYKVYAYIVKHNYILGGMLFTICKAQVHISALNVGHLQVVQ
jgi:hypothetical protein